MLMIIRDLATARLLAMPVSSCGMPVVTVRPPSGPGWASPVCNALIRVASWVISPAGIRADAGIASQEACPTGSPAAPKAAGATISGP
jgi:hypothetical protein